MNYLIQQYLIDLHFGIFESKLREVEILFISTIELNNLTLLTITNINNEFAKRFLIDLITN